jgi:hypothetical protein
LLSQLLSGVFVTHRILLDDLLFAYREIGSRDIARLTTLLSCYSNHRVPNVDESKVNGFVYRGFPYREIGSYAVACLM